MERTDDTRSVSSLMLVTGLLLFVIVTLWLPFGFRNMPLVEEWVFLSAFDQGTSDYGHMDILRPLTPVTFYIPNLISSHPLIGYGITLAVLFFAKGFFFYLFLSRLIPHRALLLLATILFILYPSDEGLFSFRAINIQTSVVCLFMALNSLLILWGRAKMNTLHVFIMWLSLLACLWIYDLAYPIVFLTPLLLVWLGRGISRKTVVISTLWLALPTLLFIRQLIVMQQQSSAVYQLRVFSPDNLITDIVNSLFNAYKNNLFSSWRAILGQIDFSGPFLSIALATGILSGLIIWFSYHRTSGTQEAQKSLREERSTYAMLLIVGLAGIGLGFALMTITQFRYDNWRVFMFSSAGSAIVVAVVTFVVSHSMTPRQPVVFSLVAAGLISMAMLHMLNQHQNYVEYSEDAKQLLGDVIAQVPQLKQETLFLVLDTPPTQQQPYQTWMFLHHPTLTDAFRYVYQDYNHLLAAETCEKNRETRDEPIRTEPAILCEFNDTGINVYRYGEKSGSYQYAQAILFSYSLSDGYTLLHSIAEEYLMTTSTETQRYQPCDLIVPGEVWPPRALSMLGDQLTIHNTKYTNPTSGC